MWTCKAEGLFVDLRGPFVSLIGPFVFLKVSSFALRKFCIGLKGPNVSLREPSYVTYTILVGPPFRPKRAFC